MTSQQLQIAIDSVRTSLQNSSLAWILDEVNETLRLGKPSIRTVTEKAQLVRDIFVVETADEFEFASGGPRSRKTRVAATEPYTKPEELQLILDAIERTAIAAADMRAEIVKNLDKRYREHPRIIFERNGQLAELNDLDSTDVEVGRLRDAVHSLRLLAR